MLIMNPGTEARPGATEANALEIAKRLAEDIGFKGEAIRKPDGDYDGWFRFQFANVEVDIPGDDPDQVCEGRPFRSRRLYVDGCSWLYGYAVGIAAEHMEKVS